MRFILTLLSKMITDKSLLFVLLSSDEFREQYLVIKRIYGLKNLLFLDSKGYVIDINENPNLLIDFTNYPIYAYLIKIP